MADQISEWLQRKTTLIHTTDITHRMKLLPTKKGGGVISNFDTNLIMANIIFRRFVSLIILLIFPIISYSQTSPHVFVQSYFRTDGTFVNSHYRTSPNETMYDNFSTIGNVNPYTGKAGWIEPYNKIITFSKKIPSNSKKVRRVNFQKVFHYLKQKDLAKFAHSTRKLSTSLKSFLTGLYYFNDNDFQKANKVFRDVVAQTLNKNDYLWLEAVYWQNLSGKYVDADREIESLNQFILKNQSNPKAIITQVKSVKNPLNSFIKNVILFKELVDQHQYSEAISAYDSIVVYAKGDEKIYFNENRDDVEQLLKYKQNFDNALKNDHIYFPYPEFLSLFQQFYDNGFVSKEILLRNGFEFKEKIHLNTSQQDSVYFRVLTDLKNNSKVAFLSFEIDSAVSHLSKIYLMTLKLSDEDAFKYYKLLINHSYNLRINESILFDDNSGTDYTEFLHYNKKIVAGYSLVNNIYSVYFYAVKGKSGFINFETKFK